MRYVTELIENSSDYHCENCGKKPNYIHYTMSSKDISKLLSNVDISVIDAIVILLEEGSEGSIVKGSILCNNCV